MTPTPSAAAAASGLSKGEATRLAVLDAGIALSSTVGLGGVSLSSLARHAGMSKSGLFAHFDSKEELQLQIIERARARFVERVVAPAFRAPRGLPRLRALMERWQEWDESSEMPGGCVFVAYSREFDGCPGVLRDAVLRTQQDWVNALTHAAQLAVDEGHFRTDLKLDEFVNQLYGAILSFQFYKRLLRHPDAGKLLRAALENLFHNAADPSSGV